MNKRLIYFILVFILSGCDGSGAGEEDGGVPDGTVQDGNKADAGEADTDADTDTDSDSDADADADSDADGDLDAGEDACMYDPEDRVGWVRTWGGENVDEGDVVAVGPDGTVVVAGIFRGTTDFDPGSGQEIHTSTGDWWSTYVSKFSEDGDFIWNKIIGGTGRVEVRGIGILEDGSIILGGSFTETADFDPSSNKQEYTASSDFDSYILSLSKDGEFEWLYLIKGDGNEIIYGMDVSEQENIYFCGDFKNTLIFEYDGGVDTYTASGVGGESDSWVAKLDPDGSYLWSRSMGGGGQDVAEDLGTGPDDSVIVIGEFEGNMDFDPGPGEDEYECSDLYDVYLIHLDGDGDYVWGKHISGNGIEFGPAVEVDDDGNIYAAVEHSNQVDFDPDTAGFEADCDNNYCFSIASYDAEGSFSWVSSISGTGVIHDVEDLIVTHEGVILTGDFEGIADFDPGPGVQERMAIGWDTYLLNLSLDGDYDWVTTIGGDGGCSSLSIFQGLENDLFMTGFYYLTVDFDPTSCRDERTSGVDSKDRGAFLWKLNENGNYYP